MKRIPKYSSHKATGQARVRLDGKTYYLGQYGSDESRKKYDHLIAKWLTSERVCTPDSLTVSRLCVTYIEQHAKPYYRKNGRQTSELGAIQAALKPLVDKFGGTKVTDFGPAKLKVIRKVMLDKGTVRTSLNRNIGRIRRMFKWGVENELVSPNVLAALTAIAGLRHGRSEAKESSPVLPVPDPDIEAIRPFVSRQVWGMIQLQLVTGMRPGEVRSMRLSDIDMSGDVWEYVPAEHKTEHHGRQRRIFIGQRGQDVIRQFLKADRDSFLFSPADAESERRADQRENRQSPLTPSQRERRAKPEPSRTAGDHYKKDSYSRAIKRGCVAAGVQVWKPNQLRHNAATTLRKQFDIETVRTILGHASAVTSEIYAEMDHDKSRRVIASIG